MIRIVDVTKRYGPTLALDGLSLDVPGGAVFGLLGPNGAGKTTLLRLIMGLVFPDAGQIERGGLRPADVGYLPERAFYPPRFTIRQYVTTMGRLAGLRGRDLRQSRERLLAQVGLGEAAGRRLGACSRGMLQRVGLAQALMGDPPLLLLDEPALGLDPGGQKFIREQIVALRQAGKTVLLSSHRLDEVSRICSHAAVLHRGRLVRSGDLEALLAPRPRQPADAELFQVAISVSPLPADLAATLRLLSPGVTVAESWVTLRGEAAARKAEVLRLLLDAGVDIRGLSEGRLTLEDVYLEATGE